MGRTPTGDRVRGPYRDAQGWYYDAILDGQRSRHRLRPGATEAEARDEVEGARAELIRPAATTVADAVDEYVRYVSTVSGNEATASFERAALQPLVRAAGDLPIVRLGHRQADAYLKACAAPRAAGNTRTVKTPTMATRRSYWKALARAAKWWHRHLLTRKDVVAEYLARRPDPLPWATKAGAKQINRGKAQLRNVDECRRYLDAALGQAEAEKRVAAALPLLTGVSSGELLHLQAGAVDLAGGVIHVRDAESDGLEDGWSVKTESRLRDLTIPECLKEDLAKLVDGLSPTAYIFRATPVQRGKRKEWRRLDKSRDRGWLQGVVRTVCKKAEVRVVCPHGLRGSHASLRQTVADQAIAQIGDALGHADAGRTAARHYAGARKVVPPLRIA